MRIGIIGSGLSGLAAGRKLAQAGHEITIFEKEQKPGGKLATLRGGLTGNTLFDYGVFAFSGKTREFQAFLDELQDRDLIRLWGEQFSLYDGIHLHNVNPNRATETHYTSVEGMDAVVGYLSRWADFRLGIKAGGLTYIGADRRTKRSWVINLTDSSVYEADAVIIAAPAPEAYGVLQITQDETPTRRITRYIDEVEYEPCYVLMASYPLDEMPGWNAIECEDDRLLWIINQSHGREGDEEAAVILKSTPSFARRNIGKSEDEIADLMLERAAGIAGTPLLRPHWKTLHYWKYHRAVNPIDEEFFELEMEEAPLALTGNYLGGNRLEEAYLSGLKLADYWAVKYEEAVV